MFEKKCPNCREKVERKFVFCPWCGSSLKKKETSEDFGMLGKTDEIEKAVNQMGLPFGLNGMIGNIMKQLEKELASMDSNQATPRGFKINITNGIPLDMRMIGQGQENQMNQTQKKEIPLNNHPLPKNTNVERIEAKSRVRRLPEGVIYEIDAPGVKSKNDVFLTKLENSSELKAYTKEKCYVKSFPMKLEVQEVSVKDGKIFLKIKG